MFDDVPPEVLETCLIFTVFLLFGLAAHLLSLDDVDDYNDEDNEPW